MSSINKTPHYNLSQFGDSPDDKPSWRGDYTGDMSKIDSQMFRNATDATTATSIANTAKATADSALSLAQSNKADITGDEEAVKTLLGDNTVDAATTSKTKWDNAATGVTQSMEALTALGSETTETATQLKTKINNTAETASKLAQANMLNVVVKGADNTGKTDVTALFNDLLETDDIYIPAGTYHISSSIETTEHSICASPSAHIIATAAMGSMLLIQQADHTRMFVYGGEWDGGDLAQSIINGNCAEMRLARMYAHNYLKDGFNLKNFHAAQVDSIWVEHNQDKGSFAFVTNIDSQYSNIRIWHGANGFKTRGLNMFSNIYFWADNQDTSFENIGFDMTQGAHIKGTNIYLDGACFDFYGGKVNPVDVQLDITNLIIEHNGTDQQTTPVIFQVGKYSDINITSNLNVFSAQAMKISPHYFSYHNHLGRINPQTAPTQFFNNILDPEHFFYSLNDDCAQGIVATRSTPVDTQKGLLICKLISNAYHHVKIRNKIGDLRLDFIMNPTSEYYKVFDYAVPNNYKIKYVKNTDGSVDFYLVNNLENQQTIPGLFVYFVDGIQEVIATCPAPRNTTQVDIPETAKEFINK